MIKRWVAGDYFDLETHFLCDRNNRNVVDKPREINFTTEEIERIDNAFAEWDAVQELLMNRYNTTKAFEKYQDLIGRKEAS